MLVMGKVIGHYFVENLLSYHFDVGGNNLSRKTCLKLKTRKSNEHFFLS